MLRSWHGYSFRFTGHLCKESIGHRSRVDSRDNRPVCNANFWYCLVISLKKKQLNKQSSWHLFDSLRPRQNGRYFADNIFKCIFLFENVWIWIKFSLKFVLKVRINNIPALVQIMAWLRIGDKPLSEPMMVNLMTHICVTRPQWVKTSCR